MFGAGAPVIIGPMNGGMVFPPAFRARESRSVALFIAFARHFSNVINRLVPGKRQAALLLVANQRTGAALSATVVRGNVVELVENGVDFSVWDRRPPADEAPAGVPDMTRFVFMGRLVKLKGLDLLLPAFKAAQAQGLSASLEIIGDGDERAALEGLARELGLWGQGVTFSGWLPQTECAQRLRQSDALILPSLMECGGAVVLEAMACGKPVIATRWGGPCDYLDDSCGILVAPDSKENFVQGLTDGIVKLAQNRDLRLAMGQAGYAKTQREFDWERKLDRMLELYRQVISASPTHS